MKKLNCLLVSVVVVWLLSGCLSTQALHDQTPAQRNGQVEVLETSTGVPGISGAVTSGIALGELDGMGTPGLTGRDVECVAEEGVNVFGEPYSVPGVVSENGACVELQDTAPKTVKYRVTYALLKGKILEFRCAGYVVRVADQDLDGRVDNYDLIDRAGNIVLGIFKDLKTGKVYSKSTLPGRVLDGTEARLEHDNALDVYNSILTSPDRFRSDFTNP